MVLKALRRGDTGEAVEQWQQFLIGLEILQDIADGKFGEITETATKQYQASKGLEADGIVGSGTYAKALEDGFDGVVVEQDFPPKPNFPPILNTSARQALFGSFNFQPDPVPRNKEQIKILGNWTQENISSVLIPELQGIAGAPASGKIAFHLAADPQLKGLWAAWKAKDLLKFVLTFDGGFVPRFIRGSDSALSNHAFGSAFDINYQWNKLGQTPAAVGKEGSVRLLVPVANDYGFYWGGHFNNRKDGMHFEVAKILKEAEIQELANKYGLVKTM